VPEPAVEHFAEFRDPDLAFVRRVRAGGERVKRFTIGAGGDCNVISGSTAPFNLQHGNSGGRDLIEILDRTDIFGRHDIVVVNDQLFAGFLIGNPVGTPTGLETGSAVGRAVILRQTHGTFPADSNTESSVGEKFKPYPFAGWTAQILLLNFLPKSGNLFERKFAGQHNRVGIAGEKFQGLEVGDIGLDGNMHFEADRAGILNGRDICGDDCGDPCGFCGIAQGVHLLHFVIVDNRIERQITFNAGGAAATDDLRKVFKGKVGGPGTHVELADAEINGVRTCADGGGQRGFRSGRSHQFNGRWLMHKNAITYRPKNQKGVLFYLFWKGVQFRKDSGIMRHIMQWPETIRKKLKELPDAPGVYLMRGRTGSIIYVGKAASLRKRVPSYFRESTYHKSDPKLRGLIRSITDFDVLVLKSEAQALLTEGKLIKEYKPRYNTMFKDDKRFPLLRVDLNKPFPKFELCRIDKQDGATYFGPYTSGLAARAALEFVEKRFGIRQCRPDRPDEETYKHCHNDIIRHCSAPCIGKVTPDEYMERVTTACAFLRGERPEFIKEVRAQMTAAAANQRFEEAAVLRDMMFLLHRAVKDRALVRKTGRMLLDDAGKGVKELGEVLGLVKPPRVIECFDISNISGTYAVASMVSAVDGLPAPQRYRRFRIKTVEGSDDPRMMAEAVFRRYSRLKKETAPLPDLLVVDGGITQLRAARAILAEIGIGIPSVGLAKQHEEIVRDDEPSLFLPRDSNALRVMTNLRDEAHRFAISYHRRLRSRRIRESALDEIPTIGKKKKELLLKYFGSFERLRRASLEELCAAPGVGLKTAGLIKKALGN